MVGMSRTATPRARKPASSLSPKTIRTLREELAIATAPPAAGGARVDRQKKVIFGVKMGGFESPNRHGVDGVKGTIYDRAAIAKALPLYEGLPGFADHPPRDKAAAERSIKDALGIYRNVQLKDDGWYGDFHLVPSHPLCEALLDVAERDELAGLYSISHNADGRGKVVGDRYHVTEIVEVRSCDVVTRGATTKTFFESQEGSRTMKKQLRQAILESKRIPAKLKAVMLEMDTMDQEYDEPAEGGADDWKDHLVNAVGMLVKSDDEGAHKMAKKILGMLEPEKEEQLEEADEDEAKPKEKDKDLEEDEEDEAKKKEDEKKAVEESRELCDIYGLADRKTLVESLAKLPTTKARIAVLKEIKGNVGTGRTGNKPPPGGVRQVQESRQGPKYDDLLTIPLR